MFLAYTAMVRVLVSEGNLAGCLLVWEEMKRDGVEPDVMMFVTLIHGCVRVGGCGGGNELFREIMEKGILIERAIYGVLI